MCGPLLFNSGGLCDTMELSHAVLCGQLNRAQPIMLPHTSSDDLLIIIMYTLMMTKNDNILSVLHAHIQTTSVFTYAT